MSTVLSASCSKKPQASPQWRCAHPSLTPYRNTGLDLQMGSGDEGSLSPESGDNLFITRLSDSTPGKAMHKLLALGHAAQEWKKSHHISQKCIANLKKDWEITQLRSKTFKPGKAPEKTALPSNFGSVEKKNPNLLSLACVE